MGNANEPSIRNQQIKYASRFDLPDQYREDQPTNMGGRGFDSCSLPAMRNLSMKGPAIATGQSILRRIEFWMRRRWADIDSIAPSSRGTMSRLHEDVAHRSAVFVLLRGRKMYRLGVEVICFLYFVAAVYWRYNATDCDIPVFAL